MLVIKTQMNPNEPTGLFWFKKQQKRTHWVILVQKIAKMNPLGYFGLKNNKNEPTGL